ncbi:DNA polymerase III subunit theta [Raoultella ornithinolytica]|uniref:DNA polymerase III subunit theta n=1 Tax=Raoultella ornithinolytica TaxID=54291 RepID=UPI002DBDEB5B|nr:DNA polymerase III subunit theta [Raoultella ornithinolytica]MEB6435643.1 DNA polymerase III subunit theta [Raoultella ornithinolytica]
MSGFNIAAKSPEEQDKVNVDLAASGVAYKERMNMPVVAEMVVREQPEHLREYFMERVRYYREQSIQLPRASDPRYIEMTEQSQKK